MLACLHAQPERKTSRLRFGRVSNPGAIYFITLCTKSCIPILNTPEVGKATLAALQSLHNSGDVAAIAATLVPDHFHLLLTLGNRLKIGQVMGKIKALSRSHGTATWRWQDDGFEHQPRSAEAIEDHGFYIFMNPYRAGLRHLTSSWPWWLCPQPSQLRFLTAFDQEKLVPPEWLGLSDKIESKITVGD